MQYAEVILMNMSKKEYADFVSKHEPSSPHLLNFIKAFVIGGFICLLGQGLINLFLFLGLPKENASASTSVSLIFLSALLTGLGVYDKIAKHAGAGTLVPITGFANSIVSEAIEFKSEGFVLGLGANMFKIAGPVIVYGTVASVIYGVVYWITTLF